MLAPRAIDRYENAWQQAEKALSFGHSEQAVARRCAATFARFLEGVLSVAVVHQSCIALRELAFQDAA
jgi:hypothetical protein